MTDPTAPAAVASGTAWRIRPGTPADAPELAALVRELAEYEGEAESAVASAQDFAVALGGEHPLVHCLIAETTAGSGPPVVVGTAVWFVSFSTWRGRHGIWLEDLFVRPEHRGLGLGRALLARLAAVAVERGYERLEWNVLDWNEPALGFYRRLGAEPLDAWRVHRLSGNPLRRLAEGRQTLQG